MTVTLFREKAIIFHKKWFVGPNLWTNSSHSNPNMKAIWETGGKLWIAGTIERLSFYGRRILNLRTFLSVAALVKNAELASKLVEGLGLGSLTSASKLEFIRLLDVYGEKWCLNHLSNWGKQRPGRGESEFLAKDLVSLAKAFSQTFRKISVWILKYQLSQIQNNDKQYANSSPATIKYGLKKRINGLMALLNAAAIANEPDIHREAVQHILKYPRLYPAIDLAQLLTKLDISHERSLVDWGYEALVTQLNDRLKIESSMTRAKDDWSIREKVLHSCADCQYLQKFLANPTAQTLTWPLAQERRRHIHCVIDELDIPITHKTRHVGSPHQLILTKTSALFAREEAQTKAAIEGLAIIHRIHKRIRDGKGIP